MRRNNGDNGGDNGGDGWWMYADVGERLLEWTRLGATIQIACDMCDVSESQYFYWTQLAAKFPSSPMALLIACYHSLFPDHVTR